jgi:hypothetical protein
MQQTFSTTCSKRFHLLCKPFQIRIFVVYYIDYRHRLIEPTCFKANPDLLFFWAYLFANAHVFGKTTYRAYRGQRDPDPFPCNRIRKLEDIWIPLAPCMAISLFYPASSSIFNLCLSREKGLYRHACLGKKPSAVSESNILMA